MLVLSLLLARRVVTTSAIQPSHHVARPIVAFLSANHDPHARHISTTPMLAKRNGGNSAFVVKTSKFRGKGMKTKDKLKEGVAPHKTHLESMRALKGREQDNLRNERQWNALEQDVELNQELDQMVHYLKNLGPEGDYIYQREAELSDLDESDMLKKLNALARGDAEVMEEVRVRRLEQEEDITEHELQVDDYNFLMRVYAEKGLHTLANTLLTRMEQNVTMKTTINSMFGTSRVTQTGQSYPEIGTKEVAVSSAQDSLDDGPHRIPPDATTYMYYIISLVHSSSSAPATAVRTLGRMKEHGVFPTVNVYNSVMNVCAKAGKIDWAYNMLEKMQIAGCQPDKASFTILMHAAIAQNDLQKAFETFHLMRSRVTDPDVVCFTVLIHGYAKAGRIERAINLYEDLLECGLTPTHITFNSLILACAKSHYYAHKAIEFYHEMQELYDYHPDLYTYSNVLHACAKQGDVIQAETVLRQMRQHEVPLEERTYNTLLNTYARAQIRSVVEQAPRNKRAPLPIEPIGQEPLEYDEDGREVDLTRPFKNVSAENWNYDGIHEEVVLEEEEEDEEDTTYAINGVDELEMTVAERAQLDAIRQQDQQLTSVGFADEFVPKPMDLRNFGKFQTENISRAEQLFHEMIDSGTVPISTITLNSMLGVYANALRLQRAQLFLENEFPTHKIQPDLYTYRILMQMYVRAKRTALAEGLYTQLKQKVAEGEMEMDRITIGMLVDHYARHKYLRKALVLLEEADALHFQLEERHLKKIRKLTEQYGIFTELIPEDPYAVITVGTRGKLLEKRKVRQQVIAYNQKVGKKYLLPHSITE